VARKAPRELRANPRHTPDTCLGLGLLALLVAWVTIEVLRLHFAPTVHGARVLQVVVSHLLPTLAAVRIDANQNLIALLLANFSRRPAATRGSRVLGGALRNCDGDSGERHCYRLLEKARLSRVRIIGAKSNTMPRVCIYSDEERAARAKEAQKRWQLNNKDRLREYAR
jgi:hypothetical protein